MVRLTYMTSIFEAPSWHRVTHSNQGWKGGWTCWVWKARQAVVINESKVFPVRWECRGRLADWSPARGWYSFLIPHPHERRLEINQAWRQGWYITLWPRAQSSFPLTKPGSVAAQWFWRTATLSKVVTRPGSELETPKLLSRKVEYEGKVERRRKKGEKSQPQHIPKWDWNQINWWIKVNTKKNQPLNQQSEYGFTSDESNFPKWLGKALK